MLLSGLLYFLTVSLGLRFVLVWISTALAWKLKAPMILMLSLSTGYVAYGAFDSLWLQCSSAHHQWMEHYQMIMETFLIAGGILITGVIEKLAPKPATTGQDSKSKSERAGRF